MSVPALIIALLLLVPAAGNAADADGHFAVKGAGLAKCSQFTDAVEGKDTQQLAMYVGWIGGYLSATNQLADETFDIVPWQDLRTVTAVLVNYCQRNGETRFASAVIQMAQSLAADRLTTRSQRVAVENAGTRLVVYAETVRWAEETLAELGLLNGEPNGEFDDAMRDALLAFQAERGLPESGLPDQRTLLALFQSRSG